MTEISSLLLMTLVELLLIALVTLVALVAVRRAQKKRDRVAAQQLIERIRGDEARRYGETESLLQEHFGLQGDELATVGKKISREEKRFYQTLINLYLKRDSRALESLHLGFEQATEPYRTLQPIQPEISLDSSVAQPDAEELERLQAENERLGEELRITMDTMGRMLNEYATMFSGGAGEELDKTKMMDMFKSDAPGAEDIPNDADGEPAAVAEQDFSGGAESSEFSRLEQGPSSGDADPDIQAGLPAEALDGLETLEDVGGVALPEPAVVETADIPVSAEPPGVDAGLVDEDQLIDLDAELDTKWQGAEGS